MNHAFNSDVSNSASEFQLQGHAGGYFLYLYDMPSALRVGSPIIHAGYGLS